MCVHRMFYQAGVEGDREYVSALKKDPYPTTQAAAKLMQETLDAGQSLTSEVETAIWDRVYAAEDAGKLSELLPA